MGRWVVNVSTNISSRLLVLTLSFYFMSTSIMSLLYSYTAHILTLLKKLESCYFMWGRVTFDTQMVAVLTLSAVSQGTVGFHVMSLGGLYPSVFLMLHVNSGEQYPPPEHGSCPRGTISAPHMCSCSTEVHPLTFSPCFYFTCSKTDPPLLLGYNTYAHKSP